MPILPIERHINVSPAEAETLRALVEGLTNAEMAERFGVSEAAVASRLHRFYERTGMKRRAEAIAFAVAHGACCTGL